MKYVSIDQYDDIVFVNTLKCMFKFIIWYFK